MRHIAHVLSTSLVLLCLVGASNAQETLIHRFGPDTGPDGSAPAAGLVIDPKGNLFGTTEFGGSVPCSEYTQYSCGTVFELSPVTGGGWTEKVIHNFGGDLDGSNPVGTLTSDAEGNLYGTAQSRGGTFDGAIFELSPAKDGTWSETTLYRFFNDYYAPLNPELTTDTQGNLYGTTQYDGTYQIGTVFKLTQADGTWRESTVYNFSNQDGVPRSGLVFDSSGNLYGTTGTSVYELSPEADGSWTEQVLYVFNYSLFANSAGPSKLLLDSKGNLFGISSLGGLNNVGTVFELSPTAGGIWTEKTVFDFTDIAAAGNYPVGALTMDATGSLYGVASSGEDAYAGSVYKLTPQPEGA